MLKVFEFAARKIQQSGPDKTKRSYYGKGVNNHWSIILLAAALCAPAFAQPSALHLAGTTQYSHTGTIPGYSLTDFSVSFRVHKPSGTFDSTDRKAIFVAGVIQCGLGTQDGTQNNLYCYNVVTSSNPVIGVDITGKTDVIGRFRRDLTHSTYYFDTWDGQGNFLGTVKACPGGAGLCAGEIAYTYDGTAANIGSTASASTFDVDFVQWDTGAAFNSNPPANGPTVHPAYGEWKFDNTLADASVNGLTLTMSSGSASYASSPVYDPVASIGGTQYGVAGNQTITITSSSYSSTNLNGSPTSFAYSVTAKPTGGDGTLGTPTAATTTMVLDDVLGTYSVQLVATDSHGSGTATTKIGAVPENADHTVKYYRTPLTPSGTDANLKLATGDLLRWGANTDYPQYTALWKAYVDAGGWYPITDTSHPCTGHIETGGGTFFVQDTSSVPCNFNSFLKVSRIVTPGTDLLSLPFNPGSGSVNARMVFGVTSVTATKIQLENDMSPTQAAFFPCANPGPCYSWYTVPHNAGSGGWDSWTNGNANWQYYDNGLAFYRLWLMTGIDDYLTQARAVTDEHWLHAVGAGYQNAFPGCYGESRCATLVGASIRAMDGQPWMWAGIKFRQNGSEIPSNSSVCKTTTTDYPANYGFGEPRDQAYDLRFSTVTASNAQLSDGSPDTAVRAEYCAYVRNCVEHVFLPSITTSGYWIAGFLKGGIGSPFAGPGTSPFENGIISSGALEMARDIMTTSCTGVSDRAAVATHALNLIKSSEDWLYSALDSNKGLFGTVSFDAIRLDGTDHSITVTGTVAINATSQTVTGTGTNFLSKFLPDGTTWIAIDTGITGVAAVIYKVIAVASNTSLTIDTPWPYASISGSPATVGHSTRPLTGAGTVTLTSGSPTITGIGTHFTQNFLSDCSTFISPYGDRRLYLIHTVNSDTSMTLAADLHCNSDTNWPNATLPNITYQKASIAVSGSNCSPANVLTCSGFASGGGWGYPTALGPVGDPGLNNETIAGMGYLFKAGSGSSYKTNGDAWFGNTYYVGMIPYLSQLGKPYGQIFGAGNSPNYLAWSVVAGPCGTLSFTPSAASVVVGGATGTFNATVTDPTCDRSVTSSAPSWLTCTANCTGTGTVTGIGWTAAANAGTARSATLTGGGVAFTVNQAGTVVISGGPSTTISGGHAISGGVRIQ